MRSDPAAWATDPAPVGPLAAGLEFLYRELAKSAPIWPACLDISASVATLLVKAAAIASSATF